MRKKYVGFYWTRPVPSVGFTSLPRDAEQAAQRSRTIRYQRQLANARVREFNGEMIDEIVFLEVEPDRGTEFIAEPLKRAFAVCKEHSATLLYVEFWEKSQSRSHDYLLDLLPRISRASGVEALKLYPDVIQVDGQPFDPVRHFRSWDDRIREEAAARRDQAHSAIRALADEIPEGPGRYQSISDELNRRGIPTLTSRKRPWTAENVRKFMSRKSI